MHCYGLLTVKEKSSKNKLDYQTEGDNKACLHAKAEVSYTTPLTVIVVWCGSVICTIFCLVFKLHV